MKTRSRKGEHPGWQRAYRSEALGLLLIALLIFAIVLVRYARVLNWSFR